MKIYLFLFTIIATFHVSAKEICFENKSKRNAIINKVPYYVDRVTCQKEKGPIWFVTNKLFLVEAKPSLFKKSRFLASKHTKSPLSKHSLQTSISSGVSSILSTDEISGKQEVAVSDINTGVNIRYSHHLSNRLDLTTFVSARSMQFRVDDKIRLSSKDIIQKSTGVNIGLKFDRNTRFIYGVQLRETLFLRQENNALTIDKYITPRLTFKINSHLKSFQNGHRLSLLGKFDAVLPSKQSNIENHLGANFGLGIKSELSYKENFFYIQGFYEHEFLTINNGEQESKNLNMSVGVRWPY